MRSFINVIIFSLILFASSSFQYVYEKVSMEMLTRVTRKGLISSMKADIYYTAEGKMVSHYQEPTEMIISNNKKGDILIYTVKDNSVIQKQNFLFGTDQNQLFFFLENNKTDLGLSKMGFNIKDTRFEEGLKISVWAPPFNLQKEIQKVELAHERGNPIFLGYFDKKGKCIKKVYFSNYTQVAAVTFPATITQITFENAKDSVISKTTYSNFKLDSQVKNEYLDFKIPQDAKVIIN